MPLCKMYNILKINDERIFQNAQVDIKRNGDNEQSNERKHIANLTFSFITYQMRAQIQLSVELMHHIFFKEVF